MIMCELIFFTIFFWRMIRNAWKINVAQKIRRTFFKCESLQGLIKINRPYVPTGAHIAHPAAWSFKSSNISLVHCESSDCSAQPVLKIVKQFTPTCPFKLKRTIEWS